MPFTFDSDSPDSVRRLTPDDGPMTYTDALALLQVEAARLSSLFPDGHGYSGATLLHAAWHSAEAGERTRRIDAAAFDHANRLED